MGRRKEKSFPAKVVPLHPDFAVTAATPCRLTVTIPLRLPSLLDPATLQPPPYLDHIPGSNLDDIHADALRVLRPILVGLLYALWGPNTAVLSLVGPNSRMRQGYDVRIVRAGNHNLATGQWIDQYGEEGDKIEAYRDDGDGEIEVVLGFKFRIDNKLGKDGVENPPVFDFVALETLDDGHVVFDARALDDFQRKHFNQEVFDHEWK